MHQSKPQTRSSQPNQAEPAIGIPNFKALEPSSPSSYKAIYQLKNNSAKTPVSSRNSKQTTNSTSAYNTPKRQLHTQDFDVPIKEDYLSYVFRKKLEKERAERPDQAQTPDSISSSMKSTPMTPVKGRKVLKTQRSDPVSIKGLKATNEVRTDNVVGKESMQTLIKASKVSKRSKSVTSLKKLLEKAKQGILEEESQATDRTNGDDKSTKNVVEKYISKTKGKEKDQKTPRSKDGDFTLFTTENYKRNSYINLDQSATETGEGFTPRSSINAGARSSKNPRSPGCSENLYSFKVNRPTYSEGIWASPKRPQQVSFGNSPHGEKTVEFVLKNGIEKSKEESSATLKVSTVEDCKPEEEHANEEVEEIVNEHEDVQAEEEPQEQELIEEKEQEPEELEEEEENEEEPAEQEVLEVVDEQEELSDKKEEPENNEDSTKTFERETVETEVVREIEREERVVAAVPKNILAHVEDDIPSNEPSQEEPQEQKVELRDDVENKVIEQEQETQKETNSTSSYEKHEHEENPKEVEEEVVETPQEIPTQIPEEPAEEVVPQEAEEPVVEPEVHTREELPKDLEEIKEEEEEDEENPKDVIGSFQSKMAKIETWKRLGNQENQIGLLKEVIQSLDDYEKACANGEVGEKQNVVPHKIHAYNRLASELYESGDYEKALESCRKVAEVDKCNIQALNKAFQIHTKLGNPEKAKNVLKTIKKLMQSPIILQYNQQFLLDNVSLPSMTGSQGGSSTGDMFHSRLSFFNS